MERTVAGLVQRVVEPLAVGEQVDPAGQSIAGMKSKARRKGDKQHQKQTWVKATACEAGRREQKHSTANSARQDSPLRGLASRAAAGKDDHTGSSHGGDVATGSHQLGRALARRDLRAGAEDNTQGQRVKRRKNKPPHKTCPSMQSREQEPQASAGRASQCESDDQKEAYRAVIVDVNHVALPAQANTSVTRGQGEFDERKAAREART